MVATVVNLTSASSTVHYFRREGHGLGTPADPGSPASAGAGSPRAGDEAGEDYYARRDDEHRKASRWRGSGVAVLGLKGHVGPEEFRRVLQGHVPGTDIRLGRLRDGEHEHRPGVDITLSAPKSVSLEALLGGPGSARAMRAHDAAVRATLEFIEARLLRTRRWSREERRSVQVNAPMLVAATFRHITSRNNDPQLHTHCVIANMTRDGGQWRSAEIGLLRRSEKLIGAYYRNELAGGLRKAGFALRPSMIGRVPGFEISGWPRAALEAFSSRRRQILDFIREKGWRYDARTAQRATLATRARKNEPRRAELEALWRDFAEERGLAKRTLRKIGVRHAKPPMALEIAWRALEQLEERASVFPAREALALALAHAPGLYRLEEIEGAFAELRRDKHLLPAIRRGVGEAWTTARAVRAEREVLTRMKAGIGAVKPLAARAVPENALAGLTEGQREAVRSILESRDRVVGVQGHAGSGKTAMLRRAASLMGERRVLGLAPSASAARTLSRETGLPCRTLQWFLTRCREVADGVADRETLAGLRERYGGAVLAVDEMSLVGTAQARALLRIAERLDIARLVLVGDKRQLRGVEAGQPFRQLQQAGMAVVEMDELRRQRDPDLKAAIEEMIEGEPGAALERLGSNLLEIPAEEIATMAADLWLRLSPEARAGTALLVPTRALRAEVEEAVREGLEAEGDLRGYAMEIGTLVPLNLTRAETGDARNWREGDIALFNRDMKHYRLRKDDACTVMEVEEDRVRLAHADGRPRHLKPGSDLRYRLDLFEEKTLWIREGERLRWTRNDKERGLANGERAEVLETGTKALRLRLADGRDMTFARDDPQLRHLAYAYASTVHAAQGQTHERVIAVLDTGAGPLVNRQTLYVQLSRAREQAVVLTDNREQLVEVLEANTGERLTALEAIGEAVEDRASAMTAPAKAAVSADAAADFLEGLRAERERRAKAAAALRRLAAARAAAEQAERAFAALPAGGLGDRQALRERIAALERAADAEARAAAAGEAVVEAAAAAGRATGGDDMAGVNAYGMRARLGKYRHVALALSAADVASVHLAPDGALFDRDIDTALMDRHGGAAREAAVAFGILAGRAHAAGEAALSREAGARARALDLEALRWGHKRAGRRFVAEFRAEERMAPPRSVADVRAWRDLRERQAAAREEAGEAAAKVADALEAGAPERAARWRERAGQYRAWARTARSSLPALDGLETLVRTAAAAPQDAAAWRAAAEAAEGLGEGAGRALREMAAAADREAARREAARQRSSGSGVGIADERPARPDTPEVRAARECRRIRETFERAHAAAGAGAGALIYVPGVEALEAEAARLLATPGLSQGDRRFLESFKEVIDSETRTRETIRDTIERARAHLGDYPDILERALAPKPPPPEEPPARPGLIGRARRLFEAGDDIPAAPPAPPPRSLYDMDPDYRKWDIRAEQFVTTFRNWRAIDDAASRDHADRRRIDMADLVGEFEAIRRAARDAQAEPHRIEMPDAGAFAAADQRHDPDRLAILLRAAVRPEDERDREALLELARRNRAWPEETHAVFRNHVRDAVDADDMRSLFRLKQDLPAALGRSFQNLAEECYRHNGRAIGRRQERTMGHGHGLSY